MDMKVQTPSPHGSSRTTGGHSCGRAQGNKDNIADIEDKPSAPTIISRPTKIALIYLYRSETRALQPLDQMESSEFFKIASPPKYLNAVLKDLEKKHPYTKSMY